NFDQGIRTLQQAAVGAAQQGSRIPQALSYWGLALLHALRGDLPSGVREAEQALTVMREIGSPIGILLAGRVSEHFTPGSTSGATLSTTPSMPRLTQIWQEKLAFCELAGTWLAEAVWRAGRQQEAIQIAQAALVQAEASESAWFLCTAHTTLG